LRSTIAVERDRRMKILRIIFLGVAAALLSTGAGAQARSNELVISSPANGTVVAPGQTIMVSITVNSGNYPGGVVVVGGEDGGPGVMGAPASGMSPVSSPSAVSIPITIPTNAFPGKFGITATGVDPSGVLALRQGMRLD
jgi:hypothetical protein